MQDSKKPVDKQRPGDASGGAPASDDYRHHNSGRRASGHGRGGMDAPEEFPDAHHQAGYEYSGGGQGHESNRSLARETDEDLESRSGPYTRAGQPAQPGGPGGQAAAADKDVPGKRSDTKR